MLRKAIVLVALALAGCGGSKEAPLADAEKAGELFFQRFEKGNYQLIHSDGAQAFKEQVQAEEADAKLEQIAQYGKLHQRTLIKNPVEGEGKGRISTLVYTLLFDKARIEGTLKFLDQEGEWKLLGFEFKAK
jgi:hypothetical protein